MLKNPTLRGEASITSTSSVSGMKTYFFKSFELFTLLGTLTTFSSSATSPPQPLKPNELPRSKQRGIFFLTILHDPSKKMLLSPPFKSGSALIAKANFTYAANSDSKKSLSITLI